jgi:hypothetical protein
LLHACSLLASGNKVKEARVVASEVTKRMLADYEAGDLITICAWCWRVEVDGEWVLAPRAALAAIDARYTLSHSICPDCGEPQVAQP